MQVAHATTSDSPANLRLRPIAALALAWETFRENFSLTMSVMVVLALIMAVGTLVPYVNLFFWLLVAPALIAGGARFMVRLARSESPASDAILDGFARWPSVTGAILLQALGMAVVVVPVIVVANGMLAFHLYHHPDQWLGPDRSSIKIIVGALLISCALALGWLGRTWTLCFVVLEPGCTSVIDALRRSWAMTRSNAWRWLGLVALGVLFTVAGLLAIGVGVVPATIVWYLAVAHAYEQLRPVPVPAPSTPADDEAPPTPPILLL